MTVDWPNWLAMGSKKAHFTCLCTANNPKVSLEKHIFDPFFAHFLSLNSCFSRHFVRREGPKWLAMGSKRAHFTCLGTPNGLESFLEKHIFDPFLTLFLSHSCPCSRHFGMLGGPKRATASSKRAQNTVLAFNVVQDHLWKESSFCTHWTLLTLLGTHLIGLPLAAGGSPLGRGTGV